jgi:tetraprenyl-beta-curcumene synthase
VQLADSANLMSQVGHHAELATAFLSAAQCYWLNVFPRVQRELDYWRRRAGEIPNPGLRRLALETHRTKWCNVEGAAAFATLAPPPYRSTAIRALVTFQAAYDYADTLVEQPQDDPIANGRLLHQSLLVALNSTAKHPDYYAHSRLDNDGGYLRGLTDSCRRAFEELPTHTIVAHAVRRAAKRIVTYQSLNHNGINTHEALARWAHNETPSGTSLRWWETSAACASSLTALALLSAAANPTLNVRDVVAIESAYHPWVGALHTLLDSLVDWNEDELAGQPSLLDRYDSIAELTETMQMLARRSREAIASLPQTKRHAVLLAGMTGLYLAAPEAQTPRTKCVADGVLEVMDDLMRPTLLVMRGRRRIRRLAFH